MKLRDDMGEVRLRIKLTNAMDEALVRRHQLDPAKVRSCEVTALVDTGAVLSVIPAQVMQDLGVESTGNRVAEYADGRKDRVLVTEAIVFNVPSWRNPVIGNSPMDRACGATRGSHAPRLWKHATWT